MLKNKYMILFVIMILGVCFLTALDNKKAEEQIKQNEIVENN